MYGENHTVYNCCLICDLERLKEAGVAQNDKKYEFSKTSI